MTDYHPGPRQLEALTLLAHGLRLSEVAARMGISPKTVGTYIERAKGYMGARTTGQLMFLLGQETRSEQ